MAADPRQAAEEYLEQNKIPQLFEMMTAQLLFNKPENPKAFIVDYLANVKLSGTQSLINKDDLLTMFGMFDVTKRGAITFEQANAALRSILGPSACLQNAGIEEKAILNRLEFVEAMQKALETAVPYKQ